MIRHGPTCLSGPVSKDHKWWAATPPTGVVAATDDDLTDNDIRPDLVRRIRAEIAAGTYDTPEKLNLALARLLDRLDQE